MPGQLLTPAAHHEVTLGMPATHRTISLSGGRAIVRFEARPPS